MALDRQLYLPEPRFPCCEMGLAPALSIALRIAHGGAKTRAQRAAVINTNTRVVGALLCKEMGRQHNKANFPERPVAQGRIK